MSEVLWIVMFWPVALGLGMLGVMYICDKAQVDLERLENKEEE